MDPRLWICFIAIFLQSFVLATPVAGVETDAHNTPSNDITTSSPSSIPTSVAPIIPRPCHTTRFSDRPPEPLVFSAYAKKTLVTTRRKLEFLFRWVAGTLLPEVRPEREDFSYLRSLEEPLFMSAAQLPQSIPQLPPRPTNTMHASSKLRQILGSLEAELERRSISERKSIAENLDQIFRRSIDNDERSIDSQD